MKHLGGFESTKICGSGYDVLDTTRHVELWRSDLDLLLGSGITDLRYPVPWHKIERIAGKFDFKWLDGPMEYMRRHGMRPILDPLHHTSFPDWLRDGFLNPSFPNAYERFVKQLIDRYEWVDQFTVINEPFATTILCADMGVWYPYRASQPEFCRMAVQVSKAFCKAAAAIRKRNRKIEIVRVDTCEFHFALDEKTKEWVQFCNERRFLIDDLITGRVTRDHSLWDYCVAHGVKPDQLRWLADHPEEPDIFGLDYYAHSEIDWVWNQNHQNPEMSWPLTKPRGFASVAEDYRARYDKPLMLTETNVRGTVADRITWLKHMEQQCELLIGKGVNLKGFCWFPSIDSTDWSNRCTRCTKSVDPQGIWWLDEQRWGRHASELSTWYGRLACGKANSSSLPSYAFTEPLLSDLQGFRALMPEWVSPLKIPGELAA